MEPSAVQRTREDPRRPHPRLLFGCDDLPAIRTRIATDKAAQEAWKNLLA